MSDPQKRQSMVETATTISQAMKKLMEISKSYMNDPTKFSALTLVYEHLNSFHAQLEEAIASSDDDAFMAATTELKQSAKTFSDDEASLKSILKDINTLTSVVSGITAVAKFIATL